jgi:glycosyltransferase involved in cell wall biosynthesis
MRILLVSQMYPGPNDPDLGVFVAQLEHELAARGHELERAVLDRRSGGKRRFLSLARETWKKARSFQPEVVYAHFLVPSGLIGALCSKAPLVVTAHGQDVRNIGAVPGLRTLTARTLKRANEIIAVSSFLARELETKLPQVRGKTTVIDCGVDLEQFQPSDQAEARSELDWAGEGPLFLCVGSLTERKNVIRLARAFERLGKGSLVFLGDGSAPASAALARRLRRPLPAQPNRALRPGTTRGDGLRPGSGGHAHRRPARVRFARSRRSRRSRGR